MATFQRFEDIIAWQKINYIVKFLLKIVLWLNPIRGSLFPQFSNHGLQPWLLLLMSVGHSSNPLNSGLTIIAPCEARGQKHQFHQQPRIGLNN